MKKYIQDIWLKNFNSIDKNIEEDIYAFSFYVYDEEDDPRFPVLRIGYNTNANLQKNIENGAKLPEAKWNFAYWLQNELVTIGGFEDKKGSAIISNWISELGLNYSDEENEEDFDACYEKGEKITENFLNILIGIVQEAHNNKITIKPILIHELEYYDKIRDQNIEANGGEKVKAFSDWINNM